MFGTFKRTDQAKRVIVDIETRDPFLREKGASWVYGYGHISGIGIKVDSEPSEYYPIEHEEGNYDKDKVFNYLKDIPNTVVVGGHYIQYDLGWLHYASGWLHSGPVRCTLVTSQLKNNSLASFSLDNLCKYYRLGTKSDIGDPRLIWKQSAYQVAKYCNNDIELTAKLDNLNWDINETEACVRENKVIKLLVMMKINGIKISREALNKIQEWLGIEYGRTIQTISCKNIWANASVAMFFRSLGLRLMYTPNGTPSFPNWYLKQFTHPAVVALVKARQLHKLIHTFCTGIRQSIADDGKMHPDFFNGRSDDGGTITGRLSSAHVNVQQIPTRTDEGLLLRGCFVPEHDVWYKFDYSQQEPRIMLHYASKLGLKGIDSWRLKYESDPHTDFYDALVKAMNCSRDVAKTTTLARCYGMGPDKLARMNNFDVSTAMNHLISFDRGVPWLPALKEYCMEKAKTAKRLRTLGNRYIYFNNYTADKAFNHEIQGSAADQIKEAMVQVYENTGKIPLLQVHDELAYDFSKEEYVNKLDDEIESIMMNAFELDFPVKVDKKYGLNWRACK